MWYNGSCLRKCRAFLFTSQTTAALPKRPTSLDKSLVNRQVGCFLLGDEVTKEIQLTHGKVALIDDCDYKNVSGKNWYSDKIGNTFYAVSHSIKINRIRLTCTGLY